MDLESSHSLYPCINLVGETNGGKSTLLAAITGIGGGTTTTCPIEWRIRRSDVWSACVSFGYFKQLRSELFTLTEHETITVDGTSCFCSTPQQICLLVKMAEIIAFSPIDDFQSILSMDDEELDKMYMRQLYSSSHSTGVVFVDLHCPVFEHSELTIVDLPGLTEIGNPENVNYIRKIVRHYVLQKESMTAVVARATDHERRVRRSALRYVQQVISESAMHLDVAVVLSYDHESDIPLNQSWMSAFNGARKRNYDCHIFLLPTSQAGGPFSILSVEEMQAIRQEESAYFLLVKPWCAYKERERRYLGTENILKAWGEKWSVHLAKNAPSSSLDSWITFSLVRLVIVFVVVSFVATLVD